VVFHDLKKSNFDGGKFSKNLFIHKPSLGSHDIPHKSLARSVQPFIGYKHTDKQAKFMYRLKLWRKIIDIYFSFLSVYLYI